MGANPQGRLSGRDLSPGRAGTVAIMGLAITAFTGTLASAGAVTPAPGASLGYVALANSVPKTTDNVTGSYSTSKMQIEVAVAPRDEAGLNTMLAALYDKNSPSYHRWLSTGQFDASEPRVASVARWSVMPVLASFRIHCRESVIPGSGWIAWLPRKFSPRNAGTRCEGPAVLGR